MTTYNVQIFRRNRCVPLNTTVYAFDDTAARISCIEFLNTCDDITGLIVSTSQDHVIMVAQKRQSDDNIIDLNAYRI